MGLVCVGCADGSVEFYNPLILLSQQGQTDDVKQDALFFVEEQLYSGPVTALAANVLKPQVIAAGGDELLIINMKGKILDIFTPSIEIENTGSPITSVDWNRQLAHILASADQSGLIHVWDLKLNKSITSIGRPQPNPQLVRLQWNPEIATQIAAVNEFSQNNEIQIWDLRSPNAPAIALPQGRRGPIKHISWCTLDPSIILATGDNNECLFWNYRTKTIVSQCNAVQGGIVDALWSIIPTVFALTYDTGLVDFYRFNHEIIPEIQPPWMETAMAMSISPQGWISTTSKADDVLMTIPITVLRSNQQLISTLDRLQRILEKPSVVSDSDSFISREAQQLAQIVKKDDQEELWKYLGFDSEVIINAAEHYTGKTHKKVQRKDTTPIQSQQPAFEFVPLGEAEAENFFDALNKDKTARKISQHLPLMDYGCDQGETETIVRPVTWNSGIERLIKENIIIKNYLGAIDCAMKAGRVAEALILAWSQGESIFQQTLQAHITETSDLFTHCVLGASFDQESEKVFDYYDASTWKECIAMLLSLKDNQNDFQTLVCQFALKIRQENVNASILACICAQNFGSLIDLYLDQSNNKSQGKDVEDIQFISHIGALLQLKQTLESDSTSKFDELLIKASKMAMLNNMCDLAQQIIVLADQTNSKVQEFQSMISPNADKLSLFQVQQMIRPQNIQGGQQSQSGRRGMDSISQSTTKQQLATNVANTIRPQQQSSDSRIFPTKPSLSTTQPPQLSHLTPSEGLVHRQPAMPQPQKVIPPQPDWQRQQQSDQQPNLQAPQVSVGEKTPLARPRPTPTPMAVPIPKAPIVQPVPSHIMGQSVPNKPITSTLPSSMEQQINKQPITTSNSHLPIAQSTQNTYKSPSSSKGQETLGPPPISRGGDTQINGAMDQNKVLHSQAIPANPMIASNKKQGSRLSTITAEAIKTSLKMLMNRFENIASSSKAKSEAEKGVMNLNIMMEAGQLSGETGELVLSMCKKLESGDEREALQIHKELSIDHWE